jgi:hypothetical protein
MRITAEFCGSARWEDLTASTGAAGKISCPHDSGVGNEILSILEDRSGISGTFHSGLERIETGKLSPYAQREFHHVHTGKTKYNSVPGNKGRQQGIFVAGSATGLHRFDPRTGQFTINKGLSSFDSKLERFQTFPRRTDFLVRT